MLTCVNRPSDYLKPNVLMSSDGRALISDFGLSALLLSRNGESSLRWASSTVHGSWRWMSPELFDDDARHTPASDIWAFGMVGYVSSASQCAPRAPLA